ncbi:MAG: transposase [Acidobacteria bacterium]|nr:transposase [Acidobacteriota bacterium]
MFLPSLTEFINPAHEVYKMAEIIVWEELESEFAPLYSNLGQPAKPIRLMAGLLILKELYRHSDESVMTEWVANPYYQFFCGEAVFQWSFPCDPTDLVYFRQRIGRPGHSKIIETGNRAKKAV